MPVLLMINFLCEILILILFRLSSKEEEIGTMKTGKLQLLVESLMPKANRTEDGFLCPFCEVPQKQITTHIKKNHNKEMLQRCSSEDSKEYEQELKKHIHRIRTHEGRAKKKKADPEHYDRFSV